MRPSISAVTILLWNILVTFDDEVKQVWFPESPLENACSYSSNPFYLRPLLCTYLASRYRHSHLELPNVSPVLVLQTHTLCQNYCILGLLTFLCISVTATMITTTVYLYQNLITVFEPDHSPVILVRCPTVVRCLPPFGSLSSSAKHFLRLLPIKTHVVVFRDGVTFSRPPHLVSSVTYQFN
ncbi:uncharacterized protein EV420DRAFT_477514 [Desarmillaria tabescens]|uniref:Uncharacterized protein n=1 Tax=Armillaria tabescens TaxID=1929756 RepID=A0AA39KDB5_ARMTA|nr:uncharacterized protein EV420DRAFT_477514 [Desarmillaria tabescens]KAK0457766.1 hypothetical protein EV420DRAFT_477514 [Desarmillaria tabescens]